MGGWLRHQRVDTTNGQAIDMPMNHQSLQTDPPAATRRVLAVVTAISGHGQWATSIHCQLIYGHIVPKAINVLCRKMQSLRLKKKR